MRKICIIALTMLVAAIPASSAVAGVNDSGIYPPWAPNPVNGPAPVTGQTTVINKGTTESIHQTGTHCAKKGHTKTCFKYKNGRIVKRCVTTGSGRRTCTYYKSTGSPYKVCIRKHKHSKTRCHKVKPHKATMVHRGMRTAPSPGAAKIGKRVTLPKNFRSLQGLNGEGFGSDIPAVGEIYLNGDLHCSGTLVANGLVLTAGHCVMPPNSCQYYPASSLTFVPDETVLTDYGNLTYAPYGYFQVANTVTTQSWCDGDAGGDWAFLELEPDANGYYAGQYTGSWPIYENVSPARTWMAGYPAEGVFATPNYYSGYAQYHSDTTWGGDYMTAGYQGFSSKPIVLYQSKMTGGSSGGAVINQLSDGSWGIGGVINIAFTHQCPDNSCRAGQPNYTGDNYWSDWQGSVYFDSDIGSFYQAMLQYFGLA